MDREIQNVQSQIRNEGQRGRNIFNWADDIEANNELALSFSNVIERIDVLEQKLEKLGHKFTNLNIKLNMDNRPVKYYHQYTPITAACEFQWKRKNYEKCSNPQRLLSEVSRTTEQKYHSCGRKGLIAQENVKNTCNFCQKLGHLEQHCRQRLRQQKQNKQGNATPEKEKLNRIVTKSYCKKLGHEWNVCQKWLHQDGRTSCSFSVATTEKIADATSNFRRSRK